ncbi:MAG: 4'-phosphopantetheinyl transferase superfamily protein [Patescibacteria group bacterium]
MRNSAPAVHLFKVKKINNDRLCGFLSEKEVHIYKNISSWKKQKDWFSGRMAVKKAIRSYFLKKFYLLIDFNKIEILNKKSGRPFYKIIKKCDSKILKEIKETDISISHCGGIGVGSIVNVRQKGVVGIDIEKIKGVNRAFSKKFLTDNELKIISRQNKENKRKLIILFWCVKEAYLKAVGCGLSYSPKLIDINFDNLRKKPIKLYNKNRELPAIVKWRIILNRFILTQINIPRTFYGR